MRAVLALLLSLSLCADAFAEGALVLLSRPDGSHEVELITGKRTIKALYDAYERVCAQYPSSTCEIKQTFNMQCAATARAFNTGAITWSFGASVREAEQSVSTYCTGKHRRCVPETTKCDYVREQTLLCTDSIFNERQGLKAQVFNNPARLQFASKAAVYLEGKYCAYAPEPPAEDGDREWITDTNCTVATGMRLGERVYWEVCHEGE